jgi:precorrin-2/cobalt-factor-2 C20-methyltransferase
MKVGQHLPKLRRALERSGGLPRALYVERGTMAEEKMIPLTAKPDDDAPYFAVVLVPGWEQRPGAKQGNEPGGESGGEPLGQGRGERWGER